MGALSKSIYPFYNTASTFFSIVLPEFIRFIVLSLCVLWNLYWRRNSDQEYVAILNKKSSKFVYRRRKLKQSKSIECPICLSEFVNGDVCRDLVECRHVFHQNCLEKWLLGGGNSSSSSSSRATCPLCRRSVLPEEIMSQHKTLQCDHDFARSVEEELALILLSTLHSWTCHGMASSKQDQVY